MTPEEQLYTLMAQAEDIQVHAVKLQSIASETLEKLDRQISILQDIVGYLRNQDGSSPDYDKPSK